MPGSASGTACVAAGCSNRKQKGKSFHRFPKEEERRKLWVAALKREKFEVSPYSRICADHFEESCFDRTGQTTRLKENAVPSIFSFPALSQKEQKHGKNPTARSRGKKSLSSSSPSPPQSSTNEGVEGNTPRSTGRLARGKATESSSNPSPPQSSADKRAEGNSLRSTVLALLGRATAGRRKAIADRRKATAARGTAIESLSSSNPSPPPSSTDEGVEGNTPRCTDHSARGKAIESLSSSNPSPPLSSANEGAEGNSPRCTDRSVRSKATVARGEAAQSLSSSNPSPPQSSTNEGAEGDSPRSDVLSLISKATLSLSSPIALPPKPSTNAGAEANAPRSADHSYCASPDELKKHLEKAEEQMDKYRKKIKSLHKVNRRLRRKVASQTTIVKELKSKKLVSQSCAEVLETNLSGVPLEIMKKIINKVGAVHPSVKAFAVTLYLHSPKAYEFVKEAFGLGLPHATTIRRWFQPDSDDGTEGSNKDVIQSHEQNVAEVRSNDSGEVLCTLMLDEMSTEKHMEWSSENHQPLTEDSPSGNITTMDLC